ncbi:MAG: hypothetical protein ACK5C3_05275 [bacterium]
MMSPAFRPPSAALVPGLTLSTRMPDSPSPARPGWMPSRTGA